MLQNLYKIEELDLSSVVIISDTEQISHEMKVIEKRKKKLSLFIYLKIINIKLFSVLFCGFESLHKC